MRAWFLRVTHPAIDRKSLEGAEVAPILFMKIQLADLHVDMGTEEIDIPDLSESKRRQFYSARDANRHKQVKFIRVGADLGCGHRLSRIFPGNYYHFIPIPRHNDPEFCRFTYGDVVSRGGGKVQTKGRSLMNLRTGDMLVFYAGFDSEDQT